MIHKADPALRRIIRDSAVSEILEADESLVAFLSDPRSYPEAPTRIKVRETHMSRVFLTEHYAYKLKKPVTLGFLDYSTPESRRKHCEIEVRLNRRLAVSVYLGVVPVCLTADGQLQLGEPGKPVNWLVQMQRLPARDIGIKIRKIHSGSD